MPDGDFALAALKLRNIAVTLIVQPNLAVFDQFHDAPRWSPLPSSATRRRRSCRASSARARHERAVAIGLVIDDLAFMPDQHDGAGNLIGLMAASITASSAGPPAVNDGRRNGNGRRLPGLLRERHTREGEGEQQNAS